MSTGPQPAKLPNLWKTKKHKQMPSFLGVSHQVIILRARKIEDIPHELLQGIFYLKCFRATTQKVVQIEDGL